MQDSGSHDEMATLKNNCVSQVHLNSDDISLHKKLSADYVWNFNFCDSQIWYKFTDSTFAMVIRPW